MLSETTTSLYGRTLGRVDPCMGPDGAMGRFSVFCRSFSCAAGMRRPWAAPGRGTTDLGHLLRSGSHALVVGLVWGLFLGLAGAAGGARPLRARGLRRCARAVSMHGSRDFCGDEFARSDRITRHLVRASVASCGWLGRLSGSAPQKKRGPQGRSFFLHGLRIAAPGRQRGGVRTGSPTWQHAAQAVLPRADRPSALR